MKGFTRATEEYSTANLMSVLLITASTILNEAFEEVYKSNFGGTDCASTMLDVAKNNIMVDAFIIITDNETWEEDIHPVQALQQYRSRINPKARMIVIGITSTGFSIADPSDMLSLDVTGFDTNAPSVIAEFY